MNKLLILVLLLTVEVAIAQTEPDRYTRYDTLRGSITHERAWWDLVHYDLSVSIDPENKSISGNNVIRYKVLESNKVMQIDLQAPLLIDAVYQKGNSLEFKKDSSVYFIQLQKNQDIGDVNEIRVEYSGNPRTAFRAPWDGGFSWAKDKNGKHFIATSCQGIGASIWWPCKDHMYDEPDEGMTIRANVPKELIAVANGRLEKIKKEKNNSRTYVWKVVNPINNYGVNINVGDYVHFSEKYAGEKGSLDMDYWVLPENLKAAKIQFKDAPRTIEALEFWFGPYPFYEDSYKLVEVPYWGMEHQSSVTYGNDYKNGMKGRDHTNTEWDQKFDFIIVHESAHEWFANSITYKDMADMWIHESFAAYAEALFVEHFYGKEAGAEYIRGKRMDVKNEKTIIADYNVNQSSGADMYPKGCNMLHTLRQIVNDDEKWRLMLRKLNEEFYHQTVTTKEIEDFIAKELGLDLTKFFDQYLRDNRIPVFEYRMINGKLIYRWSNCISGFSIPLKVSIDGKENILNSKPGKNGGYLDLENENPVLTIDSNYYIYQLNTMGN